MPLSRKRPLERAHTSLWESHDRTQIVGRMDGNVGTFHCVQTHQDALANFAYVELVVSPARNDGAWCGWRCL